jgi:hypothetical protein
LRAKTTSANGFVDLNTRGRKKLQIKAKKDKKPPPVIGIRCNTPELFNISYSPFMLNIRRVFFGCFVLGFWLFASPAYSLDYHLGLDLGGSYTHLDNYLDRGSLGLTDQLHFSGDRSYSLVWADPHLSFTLKKGISGYIQADIAWENSDVEVAEEGVEAELSNAYLSLSKGGVSADVGLQTVWFGKGLIMADDVPAVVLNLDHGKKYLQLTLAQVLDSSPMVAATLGYRPGYLEKVSLFGIWFNDRDNGYANAIPYIYRLLYTPNSDGDLYWMGASAELFAGGALFSAVSAYQWGSLRLYNDTLSRTNDVSAYMADISLEGNLTSWSSLGAFLFLSSGDDTPRRGDLNTFVAIMPYNPRAAIFFDPEFLGRDPVDEMLTFNGGFFGGVIAPGLTLHLESGAAISAETTVATFYAQQDLNDGSRWYGWEIDFELSYTFAKDYTIYAEAAQFRHGDYYESLLNEPLDPATRLSVGLRWQLAR